MHINKKAFIYLVVAFFASLLTITLPVLIESLGYFNPGIGYVVVLIPALIIASLSLLATVITLVLERKKIESKYLKRLALLLLVLAIIVAVLAVGSVF